MHMALSQVQLMQQIAQAWVLGLPIKGTTACRSGPCPLMPVLQPSAAQLLRWAQAAAGWQLTLEPSICAEPGRRKLHAAAVKQHWHSLAVAYQHGEVQWGIASVLRPGQAAQRHLPKLQPSGSMHLTRQVSLQSESHNVIECTILTMTCAQLCDPRSKHAVHGSIVTHHTSEPMGGDCHLESSRH